MTSFIINKYSEYKEGPIWNGNQGESFANRISLGIHFTKPENLLSFLYIMGNERSFKFQFRCSVLYETSFNSMKSWGFPLVVCVLLFITLSVFFTIYYIMYLSVSTTGSLLISGLIFHLHVLIQEQQNARHIAGNL